MLCIFQGIQGLPGKPVRHYRLKLTFLYLSGSEFVVYLMTDVDIDFTQQGEDGEPGYPGPQGPPGVKVCIQFILIVCIQFCFVFFWVLGFSSSCIDINVYHTLTKGEPGMGEKGEKGFDGLPGVKVKHRAQILNDILLAASLCDLFNV